MLKIYLLLLLALSSWPVIACENGEKELNLLSEREDFPRNDRPLKLSLLVGLSSGLISWLVLAIKDDRVGILVPGGPELSGWAGFLVTMAAAVSIFTPLYYLQGRKMAPAQTSGKHPKSHRI
jgi:hypothetical protein